MGRYVAMLRTDPDDRDLTEWALAETGNSMPVRFVADVTELESLVSSEGDPVLILLNDLGAIHKGHERLAELKSNEQYRHIPVIVLGEVSTDDYIRACYRAGANSFIIKPSTVAETRKKVELFFNYWFQVAEV